MDYAAQSGYGWLSAGSFGVLINNQILRHFIYEALPPNLAVMKPYQMAQLVMNALFGNVHPCFVVNETFTLLSLQVWRRVHNASFESMFMINNILF